MLITIKKKYRKKDGEKKALHGQNLKETEKAANDEIQTWHENG